MDKEPDPPQFLPRLGDDRPEDRPQRKWEELFYPQRAPERPEIYERLLAEYDRHKAYMAKMSPEDLRYDDALRQREAARVKIMALVDTAKAGMGNGLSPEDKAQAEAMEEERYQRRKQALDAEQERKVTAARERARARREAEELSQAGRESTEAAETEQDRAAARIGAALREEFEKHGDKVVRLRPVEKEREEAPKIDWRARMRWADDLKATPVPELEFRITGFWPRVWLTQLNGDGGSGKTSLLTQMFSCLSAGASLFGRPCLEEKVMLFSSEEDDDIAGRRLNKTPNVGRFPIFNLLDWPEDYDLCRPKRDGSIEKRPFWNTLRDIIGDMQPGLVGLDHVGDMLPVNENDKAQVNDALQLLRLLHAEFGVDFVLSQHMSRLGQAAGRRDAGTPQWGNKARYRWALYPPGLAVDAGEDEALAAIMAQARVLEVMKDNYGGTVGTKIPLLRQGWSFVEERGEVNRARERSLGDALTAFVAARRREDAGIMWPASAQAGGSLVAKFREPLGRLAPPFAAVAEAVAEMERAGGLVRIQVPNAAGVAKPYLRPA